MSSTAPPTRSASNVSIDGSSSPRNDGRLVRRLSSNSPSIATDCQDREGILIRIWQKMRLSGLCIVFLLLLQVSHYRKELSQLGMKVLPKDYYDALLGSSTEDGFETKMLDHKHVHFCEHGSRNNAGFDILLDELDFHDYNALKKGHDNWDLIYGGYPFCGEGKEPDWNFESGINDKLYNKGGFENMKPHQVYHPCMGCGQTYCNKRQLCQIQHEMDPKSCYLLPDHKKQLLEEMSKYKDKPWILKTDGGSPNGLHGGKGVQYIHSIDELPDKQGLEENLYIVQPFLKPYLGQGEWRRKMEVRYYVTITHVNPDDPLDLRAYAYHESWLPMSTTLFVKNPKSDMERECMEDSHAYRAKCKDVRTPLPHGESRLAFSNWTKKVDMAPEEANHFHKRALEILAYTLQRGSKIMGENKINKMIAKNQATCFSFMRADFGMTKDVEPFMYELNEFPYEHEPGQAGAVQKGALRDLFSMIGLDRPVGARVLSRQERKAYEEERIGGWVKLDIRGASPASIANITKRQQYYQAPN